MAGAQGAPRHRPLMMRRSQQSQGRAKGRNYLKIKFGIKYITTYIIQFGKFTLYTFCELEQYGKSVQF